MNNQLSRGVHIIVDRWLQINENENLLIVTSEQHKEEASAIQTYATQQKAKVDLMMFPTQRSQVGHYFDDHADAFDAYDVILGATTHSLVTTKAVKRAISRGSRYLSLPLSTNDNRSMLEYEFLQMDPDTSQHMARPLLDQLNASKIVRVTTELGTDLTVKKENRKAKLFHGVASGKNAIGSASFEVYFPMEETKTEGVTYVDASLGYLGVPEEPVKMKLEQGRIVEIEDNGTGMQLKEYLDHFNDDGMYVAGEFGIGLNRFAKCNGNCYIEDESTYGTFHIGFGRNIALGGVHEAKGHFDLVFHKPDIYADDVMIMKQGKIMSDYVSG